MKKQTEILDERQKQINQQAVANSAIFLMICISISMIYKVITTEDLSWEFWALLGASLVILISRRVLGDVEQPKNLFGKPLPVGNSKEDKHQRNIDYALQSTIFALACAVMDILLFAFGKNDMVDYELAVYLFPTLPKGLTITITAVLAFATSFIISYIAEYLVGEYFKVRRYNQMISELEDDDE